MACWAGRPRRWTTATAVSAGTLTASSGCRVGGGRRTGAGEARIRDCMCPGCRAPGWHGGTPGRHKQAGLAAPSQLGFRERMSEARRRAGERAQSSTVWRRPARANLLGAPRPAGAPPGQAQRGPGSADGARPRSHTPRGRSAVPVGQHPGRAQRGSDGGMEGGRRRRRSAARAGGRRARLRRRAHIHEAANHGGGASVCHGTACRAREAGRRGQRGRGRGSNCRAAPVGGGWAWAEAARAGKDGSWRATAAASAARPVIGRRHIGPQFPFQLGKVRPQAPGRQAGTAGPARVVRGHGRGAAPACGYLLESQRLFCASECYIWLLSLCIRVQYLAAVFSCILPAC